jgi:hypothetical protein
VKRAKEVDILFADNDVEHIDETGADHESFSFGLKKSLFNYMQGLCIDDPLSKWFEMKVPKTTVAADHILKIITEDELPVSKPSAKIIFLGTVLKTEVIAKSKKGNRWEELQISFATKRENSSIQVDRAKGEWLVRLLPKLSLHNEKQMTLQEVKEDYELNDWDDFELFWDNKPISLLYKAGLLRL